jgi:hypothetical protein
MSEPMRRDRSEAAFERQLAIAARGLILEPLPPDLVAAPSAEPRREAASRRWGRLGTAILAAAAVVALAVWLGGRTPPTGGGPLPFKGVDEIRLELLGAGYSCIEAVKPNPGGVPTPQPSPPAVPDTVCSTPDTMHPLIGALILEHDAAGAVQVVHAKADILGTPTGSAEPNRQALLYQLVGLTFARSDDAAAARAWLRATIPIEVNGSVTTEVGSVLVTVARTSDGGYQLELAPPRP